MATGAGAGYAHQQNCDWWEESKGKRHEVLSAVCNDIQERQAARRDLNLHCLRLYSERQVLGMTAGTYSRTEGGARFQKPKLGLNVVRNCIDAATAMITRTRPRVAYLPNDADFEMQQRAKCRTKFVAGLFHMNSMDSLGPRAFKDGGIFGTGLVKVCREIAADRKSGSVRFERTFPGEVWVDDAEAVYGEPRSLYQIRAVDKKVLAALYPGKKDAIEKASPPDYRFYGQHSIANQALVYEAWHLPSAQNANDGWHGICVDSGELYFEKYKHETFPFGRICWNEESLGWWGTGLAQQLTGIQYEINMLVRQAQIGLYSSGNMKVAVERGAKIVNAQINNDMWMTKLEYTGQPPIFMTPEPLSGTLKEMLQFYIDQAYAITGISQLAARGEIPAGLSGSGRSQLVYKDTDSQRFVQVSRQYEQMHIDLGERALEAAADVYDQVGEVSVPYATRRKVEYLGFEDVQGDKDEFQIQSDVSSALPYTLAGRTALADQWEAKGWIDSWQAKKLAGVPDIDAELAMSLAPIELIDERIDRILTKGDYLSPHPRMNLQLAFDRSTLAFQRAELDGCPPDKLDLLGQFIDECHDQLEMAEVQEVKDQAAIQATMAGGGAMEQTATPTEPMPTEAAAWDAAAQGAAA